MRAHIEDGVVYSPYPYIPLAKDGTLHRFLTERLTVHGSKTALICGRDKLTFLELRDKVRRCAAGLCRQGIGKGDRVYVHVGNSIESFVAMCSVPLTGATLVSSDIMWKEDEIIDRMGRSGATHVLTDEDRLEMFARIIRRRNIKKAFVVGEKRPGFESVFELCGNEPLNDNEKFARGGCTFVMWTTGTTGASKGVEHSEEGLLRQISCMTAGKLLVPNGTLLGDWSLCCFTAFTFWILALHLGSTIVISRTCHAVPLDVVDAIKGCEAVTMITFASKLRLMLNFMKISEDWDAVLRKSLRRIVLIAYTPPPGLAEELTSTFQLDEFRNSYGMSEAGGCMTVPPTGEVCGRNAGFPIPGARLRITDTVSGKVLGPMQCGEVLFDTPCTAVRYLEGTTGVTDEQGWIHTGDLGYYDNDGRLFLCGRLKTMLVCQRRKVPPLALEHCLLEHAAVEEVAVIGVPAPDGDQFPAAVVVTKQGYSRNQKLADDLKRHVAERKPSMMHMHGGVYFVDALPKNALGKVRAASLRELLGTLRRMDSADEIAIGDYIY